MPKDKIENSIRKGTGEGSENRLEEAQYEAMGPSSTMLIILTITDNKNRTVSDLRRILEKHGGKMADGGVSWNFKRAGIIYLSPDPEQIEYAVNSAIENNAEDVVENKDGSIKIITSLENFNSLKEKLSPFSIRESGMQYIPQNPVTLDEKQKEKYDRLIEDLTDHQDVQEVFDNVQES